MTRQGKRIVHYLMGADDGVTALELRRKLKMPMGTVRRELPSLTRDLLVEVTHRDPDAKANIYTATKRAFSLRLS